jgi:hypothetical protein
MVNLKVKQSYTSVGDGGNQATNIYSFKWEVNVIWCFEIVVPNSRKKKRKVVLGGCFIVEVCVSTMSYSTCYSLKEVKSSLPIKVLREVF